jgi:hypothetical protein
MAKIPYVTLSSTINTQRLIINRIIDSIGDLALLTTDSNSTIVDAINEVDARLDSINSTQLSTPLVSTTDLTVADSARIANNFSVGGTTTLSGTLTLNGSLNGSVSLDSSFTATFLKPKSIATSQLIDQTITVNGVIISLGGSGNVDITDSVTSVALTRSSILAVDAGGDGSFTYDSATGAFTYTGPSASEVRAHFAGGTGITITTGTISIDSAEIVNFASPIRALFTGGDGLTFSSGSFAVGPGVGIKVAADDVSIDSAEIVNFASPIRALFTGGSGVTITTGTISIDSAEVVNFASPIRALFSGDSNILYSLTTGAIKLDSSLSVNTITVDNLNGDSATFTGIVNALDFNSTSDIKFKENVASLENSINTLNQIRPVSFNWIGGNKSYGVIAQELEQILPELVNEDKYGIKRVSYTPIIALLIDAIKAHEVEIQKLKNCQCNCK